MSEFVYEKTLPQSELDIIKGMWALGGKVSARELNESLDKGWRVQTLITHLVRMCDKGVVTREHCPGGRGPRYYYTPTIGRDAYVIKEVAKSITNLFDGDVRAYLDALYATGAIEKDDAEYLRTLVTK